MISPRKCARAEDAIAEDLGVVDRAVIEVKIERALRAHEFADGDKARLEHREKSFAPAPGIVVRHGAALFGLAAAGLSALGARSKGPTHVERRVEVHEIEQRRAFRDRG